MGFALNAIAAISQDGGIGYKNDLLYRNKEDLQKFKEHTLNCLVVMGRKTCESLPQGKPLPGRVNIVLTRDPLFKRKGFIVFHDLPKFFNFIYGSNNMVWVIGGGQIYSLLLKYCSRLYLTRFDSVVPADTFLSIPKSFVLEDRFYKNNLSHELYINNVVEIFSEEVQS